MKRYSISSMSRSLVAAVVIACTALSGCATMQDESFFYAENTIDHPIGSSA